MRCVRELLEGLPTEEKIQEARGDAEGTTLGGLTSVKERGKEVGVGE